MELDELKTTWTALEQQLKKNETLNKQILLEMLRGKSNKSLNKLRNHDFTSIIIWLLFIPFGIWLYTNHVLMHYISVKILAIVLVMNSAVGIIWGYDKLKYLMKIDFSKNVKDNMFGVNKYDVMIKQEKVVGYCVLMPMVYFLISYCYYEFNADISSWTFLIVCMIVGVVLTFWSYKKIYDPNIQSIKKSLDELKELVEEA